MARTASFAADVFTPHTDQKVKLGTRREMPDGRVFRYSLLGASNVAAGRVVQSVVPTSAHVNIAVQAAAAVGDLTVNVSLGATAVVADEYADGYLYVNDAGADTTTEGYLYRIRTHPAAALSTTLAVTLYNDNPVKIALTTNSEVSLIHNEFRAVIIHPSPPTARPVGVCPVAVTAGQYFWLQTRGPAAVLTEGTIALAKSVVCSSTTDGAVAPWVLTEATPNTEITAVVGFPISVNATTEESLVFVIFE
jgi:hypothetical protein